MNPLWALPVSLLIPIVPWMAISAWWVGRHLSSYWIWLLFAGGAVLDLWWGRVIGSSSIFLLGLAAGVYYLRKFWPVDIRFYWPATLITGVILFEAYFYLT